MSARPADAPAAERPRIGELLQARARLDQQILARALKLQRESGERLGQLLVQLGMVSERDLADAVAAQLGLSLLGAEDYPDTSPVDEPLAPEFLRQAKAVPVALADGTVRVAMADPQDRYTRDALSMALGRPVDVRVGAVPDIEAAIERGNPGA